MGGRSGEGRALEFRLFGVGGVSVFGFLLLKGLRMKGLAVWSKSNPDGLGGPVLGGLGCSDARSTLPPHCKETVSPQLYPLTPTLNPTSLNP